MITINPIYLILGTLYFILSNQQDIEWLKAVNNVAGILSTLVAFVPSKK